jgi:uncharacterized protein (DUF2147 family)
MIATFLLLLLSPDPLAGTTWRNPRDSVHVRFEACGTELCGTVTWASDKAVADAAKGSKRPLVGTRIFRDFRQVRPDRWKGKVYVPDINLTFNGTVTLVGDTLVGRGCLFAGIGCKSQTWQRVSP